MRQLTKVEGGLYLDHIQGRDRDTLGRAATLKQFSGTEEQAVLVIREISMALEAGETVVWPGGCFLPNDGPSLVRLEDRCPSCGEAWQDELVWIDDETVDCQTCGCRYTP